MTVETCIAIIKSQGFDPLYIPNVISSGSLAGMLLESNSVVIHLVGEKTEVHTLLKEKEIIIYDFSDKYEALAKRFEKEGFGVERKSAEKILREIFLRERELITFDPFGAWS